MQRCRPIPRHEPGQVVDAARVRAETWRRATFPSGLKVGWSYEPLAVGQPASARLPPTAASHSDWTTSANAASFRFVVAANTTPLPSGVQAAAMASLPDPHWPAKPAARREFRTREHVLRLRARLEQLNQQRRTAIVEPPIPVADREAVEDPGVPFPVPCARPPIFLFSSSDRAPG